MNPAWILWIHASVNKWFGDVAQGAGLPFHVEGDGHEPIADRTDYVEIRCTGPVVQELSKGWFKLLVEINVFVVSRDDDKDVYKIYRNAGSMLAGFARAIPVFEFAEGDPDPPLLGCLQQTEVGGKCVLVGEIGQINPNMAQREQSLSGFYELYLSN
jgi:hypothetical protein